MTENLSLLELQVEEARAKLASDLAILRWSWPIGIDCSLGSIRRSGLRLPLDPFRGCTVSWHMSAPVTIEDR